MYLVIEFFFYSNNPSLATGNTQVTNNILEVIPEAYIQPIGVVLILCSAFFFAVFQVITKRTCNVNIDWSVTNIFASYVGLPICLAMSLLAYALKLTARSQLDSVLFYQLAWYLKRLDSPKVLVKFQYLIWIHLSSTV